MTGWIIGAVAAIVVVLWLLWLTRDDGKDDTWGQGNRNDWDWEDERKDRLK